MTGQGVPPLRIRSRVFIVSVCFLYLYLVVSSSLKLSPTVDEPNHLYSGMGMLYRGAYVDTDRAWWTRVDKLHPPIDMLYAATARLAGCPADFRTSPEIPFSTILAARWVSHLLGLIIVIVALVWSRQLWDVWGMIWSALALLGCPLFLGHAPIISSDLSGAAGGLLAAYWLWRTYLAEPRRPSWLAAGGMALLLTLAVICKISNLLFMALTPLVMVAGGLRSRPAERPLRFAQAIAVTIVSLLLIATLYGYPGLHQDPIEVWGRMIQLPLGQSLLACLNWALQLDDLLPTAVWIKGWLQPPSPRHYLLSFIYKTPLVTLIIMALGCLWALREVIIRRSGARLYLPALAAGLFLYFTTRGFYLGLRHLLMPSLLLVVLAGGTGPLVLRLSAGRGHRIIRRLVLILALLFVAAFHRHYPWYLSYFNPLAGGRMVMVDSDGDWGQGLIDLSEWQRRHSPNRPIWLAYFGNARPEAFGVSYRALLSPYSPLSADPEAERGREPGLLDGWVAISATHLAGVHLWSAGENGDYYARWRSLSPDDSVGGGSILLFDRRTPVQRETDRRAGLPL